MHPIVGSHHTSFRRMLRSWSHNGPIVSVYRTMELFRTTPPPPYNTDRSRNGPAATRLHATCVRRTPSTSQRLTDTARNMHNVARGTDNCINHTRCAVAEHVSGPPLVP
jgi:hypothetical protein